MHHFSRVVLAGTVAAGFALPLPAQTVDPVPSPLSCPLLSKTMARLELFFGAQRPSESPVSQAEWENFVDSEVAPRFPDGLSWFEGRGQWRGRDGVVVKEETRMLIVWAEAGPATETRVEAIRTAYKTRFDQDSVMRVYGWSCVGF